MTFLFLACAIIGVTAITALLFHFEIDDDLREAMNYEATMDATAKAIKGHSND